MNNLPPELLIRIVSELDLDSCFSLNEALHQKLRLSWDSCIRPAVTNCVPWMEPGTDGVECATWWECAEAIVSRRRRLLDGRYEPLYMFTETHCFSAKKKTTVGTSLWNNANLRHQCVSWDKVEQLEVVSADEIPGFSCETSNTELDKSAVLETLKGGCTHTVSSPSCHQQLENHIRQVYGLQDYFYVQVYDNKNEVLAVIQREESQSWAKFRLIRRLDQILATDSAFTFVLKKIHSSFHISADSHTQWYKVVAIRGALFVAVQCTYMSHLLYANYQDRALMRISSPEEITDLFEYDGMLWIDVKWSGAMIPLFVDLESFRLTKCLHTFDRSTECADNGSIPVYNLNARVRVNLDDMMVPTKSYQVFAQGKSVRRLAYCWVLGECTVVDLATGTRYCLKDAINSKKTVVGFQDGHLKAWSVPRNAIANPVSLL